MMHVHAHVRDEIPINAHLQIIPVEGNFKYNDEPQSSFKSIQPETVVSM